MAVALGATPGILVAAGALFAAARRRMPAPLIPACFGLFVALMVLAASDTGDAPDWVLAVPALGAALAMGAIVIGVLTSGTQLHPRWWRRFERDLSAYLEDLERGGGPPGDRPSG
jgi:hypothetical protein